MKKMIATAAATLLLVTVSACSNETTVASSPKATEAVAAPTPEYATEQQVASVIAGQEASWREVADNAINCRTIWSFDPTNLNGISCQMREETITITADTAVRDLNALEIPPSMQDLVGDTTQVLEQIRDSDPDPACGERWADADSSDCNSALGARSLLYSQLTSQLDSWGPYL